MNANISCIVFIVLIGFIAYLYYRRRRLSDELDAFIKERNFVARNSSPVPTPFVYTDASIVCMDGQIKPGMPYTLLLGSRNTGAGRTTSVYHFIGFYFPPEVNLSDAWLESWKQKVAERGDGWDVHSGVKKVNKSWGLFGPPEKLPIRVIRINDGVLIAWIGLHLRAKIEQRINDVLATLDDKKLSIG